MQNLKGKSIAIIIAIILVSSTALSIVSLPTANAHTPPWQIATTAYLSAEPNPVGVGQRVEIVMLLNWVLPGALIQNNIRAFNYSLTIISPDGTSNTTIYQPYDPGDSRFILYTPTEVGTYNLTFTYEGQVYHFPNDAAIASTYYANDAFENDTFLPATATDSFTVQQEPIPTLQSAPIPTAYWTRPIFGMNVAWEAISSNWLGGAATAYQIQQDGVAPLSAHIMWTKLYNFGGIVGGSSSPTASFYNGFSYENEFNYPIILGGMLFYQNPLGSAGSGGKYEALNLLTGQTVWTNPALDGPNPAPTFAQLDNYQNADQHGTVGGILWQVIGTTWVGYDASSGLWEGNLTNVPSGTTEYFTNTVADQYNLQSGGGDIVRYVLNYNTASGRGWIALWNDTAAITNAPASSAAYGPNQEFRLNGQVINASISNIPANGVYNSTSGVNNCYSWNVTISGLPIDKTLGGVAPNIVGVIPGDIILGTSSNVALSAIPRGETGVPDEPWTMWAISDNPATRGQLLWSKTYPASPNNYTLMLAWQPIDPTTQMWTMTYADTGQRLGFSMVTGNQVWGPTSVPVNENYGHELQYYSSRMGSPYNGVLYVSGYGGQILAYSMLNGTLLWTFNDINSGTQTPWGQYPLCISSYADGVIFAFNGEHSPNTPLYKGERVYAVNATDGTGLWNLPDWSTSGLGTAIANVAIADGYITFENGYDGQVYVVGKGPSATSVSIQNNVAPQGTTVLIQGTVMDTSAGTTQPEQAADFPHGVPAVSDNSQSDFMSYVYQQQPEPTNVTGVPVQLFVLDSNGNYRQIGSTTTDANGMFSLAWTPDIPGAYTVFASFAGSNSYYGSSAETAFYATAAPAATVTSQPVTNNSTTQTEILTIGIAIIVVMIIIGAILAVLTIRKRT